jgi:hypothetical protein
VYGGKINIGEYDMVNAFFNLVERMQQDVNDLFLCVKEHSIKDQNICVEVAHIILGKSRKIYEDGESLLSCKECEHAHYYSSIQLNVARIMAYIFRDIDELIYAKFPILVPEELLDSDASYISMRKPDDSFFLAECKRVVYESLGRIKFIASAKSDPL